MKKIKIVGNDFETEIEEYLLKNGADEDVMAYEGHTIASVPFKSREEQIQFIIDNCIVFENAENFYVAKDDGTGDFEVQVCAKKKYGYIGEL